MYSANKDLNHQLFLLRKIFLFVFFIECKNVKNECSNRNEHKLYAFVDEQNMNCKLTMFYTQRHFLQYLFPFKHYLLFFVCDMKYQTHRFQE